VAVARRFFHDAIPIRHPQITWPQSVARHPSYMKMLADFDQVWAVSDASGEICWVLALARHHEIPVRRRARARCGLQTPLLGSSSRPRRNRVPSLRSRPPPPLLSVGFSSTQEPAIPAQVAAEMWSEGGEFDLHCGAIESHFGAAGGGRIKELAKRFRGLIFTAAASDRSWLHSMRRRARACFRRWPRAAACLLEIALDGSALRVQRPTRVAENADGGGCLPLT